jgi:hypothetical protein
MVKHRGLILGANAKSDHFMFFFLSFLFFVFFFAIRKKFISLIHLLFIFDMVLK